MIALILKHPHFVKVFSICRIYNRLAPTKIVQKRPYNIIKTFYFYILIIQNSNGIGNFVFVYENHVKTISIHFYLSKLKKQLCYFRFKNLNLLLINILLQISCSRNGSLDLKSNQNVWWLNEIQLSSWHDLMKLISMVRMMVNCLKTASFVWWHIPLKYYSLFRLKVAKRTQ